MAVREAREKLSEAVELSHSEAVFLERYGQPAAVLVSPARYAELMEALEELTGDRKIRRIRPRSCERVAHPEAESAQWAPLKCESIPAT